MLKATEQSALLGTTQNHTFSADVVDFWVSSVVIADSYPIFWDLPAIYSAPKRNVRVQHDFRNQRSTTNGQECLIESVHFGAHKY